MTHNGLPGLSPACVASMFTPVIFDFNHLQFAGYADRKFLTAKTCELSAFRVLVQGRPNSDQIRAWLVLGNILKFPALANRRVDRALSQ